MTPSSSASSPEGSPVARVIRQHLDDPGVVFVFPSEITARFWLRRGFAYSRRRTLRRDRFLDWGDFKKSFLHYTSGGRAVNRAGRTVFAWRLLEENRRRPAFRTLIPPEYAGSPHVFLPFLVGALPGLARLPTLGRRWPETSADKREDLLRLYREYRQFLAASSLYEPAYETPRLDTEKRHVLIFFPEVIEDYPEYAALIARHPAAFTVGIPPLPPAEQTAITAHDNLVAELEGVLGRIEALLDRGADPEDIVLSVSDLEHLESPLARQAELWAIPLIVHRSHPVTVYPTGRLFGRIREVVSSRFGLDAFKDLLLDRALPWRQPALAEGLVRLGLDNRLLRSPPADRGDPWEEAFGRTRAIGNPRGLLLSDLRRFYRRLRRYLAEIHSADSFRVLKEQLTAFARSLLDTSCWRVEELGAFQFALDKLDELQEVAAGDVPAFELWLSYLAGELYLPKNRGGGVPVYDYPVAEGVEPPYHFLVNASQEGTSRCIKPLPALNPYEEESLDVRERDLGLEHLRLFLHSGLRVAIGYSRRGLSRRHLPPTLFVTHGTVLGADEGRPRPPDGPEARERRAWTSGQPFPLVRLQQQGFRHAVATALAPRGVDATAAPLADPALAAAVAERLRPRKSGDPAAERVPAGDRAALRISPTALERFHGCPFAYLLESALGVSAEEYSVVTSDPRELGAIMHGVFERFFRTLEKSENSGLVCLEASRREEYRRLMLESVASVCRRWARKNPVPFAPLWLELQDQARELALAFLDVELEQMKGERVTDVELRLEARFPQTPLSEPARVLLVGKIDRVSTGAEGTTLVDYKKKHAPSPGEIFGPRPSSFQIPFYLYLMRAYDRPVERAAYYSIEEHRYRFVLGGGRGASFSPELLGESFAALEGHIANMVERIRDGDYSIGTGTIPACRFCDHGEICRRRYLLGRFL